MNPSNHNLEMLAVVAAGLTDLKDEVVFVGGATIELYVERKAAGPARPTDDVDCVAAIVTAHEYHAMEEKLRARNFKHVVTPKNPMCRWEFNGITVDVMPIEGRILGFTNRWYRDGVKTAEKTVLPDGQSIRIFSLPFILASKLEAFGDRGRKNYLSSVDMEDILTLIDGAPDFEARIKASPEPIQKFVAEKFTGLVADEDFLEAVPGNFRQIERADRVVRIMRELAGRGKSGGK